MVLGLTVGRSGGTSRRCGFSDGLRRWLQV